MDLTDYLLTSLNNVRKNRLRSLLTIIGVAVAIGALTSMLSFGIGLQKNINQEIKENRMITRINVTAGKSVHVNDSLIRVLEKIDGVECAFIENLIPVKITLKGKSSNTTIKTIPQSFTKYFSEKSFKAGNYFNQDTSYQIILTDRLINNLLSKSDSTYQSKDHDSTFHALIGSEISISALTIDFNIMSDMVTAMSALMTNRLPVRDSLIKFKIKGIVSAQNMKDMGTGAFITKKIGNNIPQMNFENIWDLMDRDEPNNLQSISVHTKGIKECLVAQKNMKEMGLKASSILDSMKEIKQMFIIMDSILGAIGIMALFISTLGLVNTLIMSIYERTKEIGIIKSLGARNNLVRKLFLTEAGCIGLIGSLTGIPLGWGVTKIADIVLFQTLFKEVNAEIVLFSFPWYLILGSIVFSVIFSILAGLYPAMRASKIDPVHALRHE